MTEEKSVSIVGSGRMGIGIATALLLCQEPLTIRMLDVKAREKGQEHSALDQAKHEIESNLKLLSELGELDAEPSKPMSRISFHYGYDEVLRECSIVFEALPEKPALKQAFVEQVEPLLDRKAIIASATSTIDLATFCKVSSEPERIVTAHWLNPAFIIPLVEVSIGEKTAVWAEDRMKSFLIEVGKIPVTVKDSPGFIVPRIQVAAMNEAVRILEEGLATAEDIDTAIKAGFGFRLAVLGLIEFIDLGGLDILYHASNYLFDRFKQDQYKPMPSVTEKMEKGEIGPKTGKGYFDYSGIDTASMFRDRYKAFLELLNLVRKSQTLSFQGGIRKSNVK
jgi:3-hydroxybutyryl-CoA dehydrogenase